MTQLYQPEDMLDPKGELAPEMFDALTPDQIAERLEIYLADGYAKAADSTNVDEAALAWAYQRFYNQRLMQLSNRPTQFSVQDGVSLSFTNDQRTDIRDRASYWLSTFYGYAATGDTGVGLVAPPSGSSKQHVTWGGTLKG